MDNYVQHVLEIEELKKEIAKLKKRVQEAEGEVTIIRGIGMNSPEFRALKKENEDNLTHELKNFFSKWYQVKNMSDLELTNLIRKNKINILFVLVFLLLSSQTYLFLKILCLVQREMMCNLFLFYLFQKYFFQLIHMKIMAH